MLFFLKDEQFERTKYIQIIVCAAFIAGLLLSYPLWHSSRDYPSIPVLSGLYFSNSFFDNSLFTLVLGLLLWGCIRPLSSFNIILLNLISLFWVCQDQSRLQPWFVIYNFILFIIITARRNKFKDQISLAAVQLIVAAIYFWSGLQKFNTSFFLETYPWLVNPFLQIIPESLEGYFGLGALLVPFIEMGAGLALLFNWQRKKIVILLMLMHAFILTCLGPLGHNWNSVVWPWNLAMLILNFLLFYEEQNFPINDVFKKNYLAGFISVLFFGIAPFFSFFGWYDSYLSFALYSGNVKEGRIYLDDSGDLPTSIQKLVVTEDSKRYLDFNDWSFSILNVPPYPETRIFKAGLKFICSYIEEKDKVKLVIINKGYGRHHSQTEVFCEDIAAKTP